VERGHAPHAGSITGQKPFEAISADLGHLGHTLLGRALYLPDARAADEEHRELTGIPDEIMFATRPQLAGDLAEHACELGTDAAMVTGDEVYGGRDLRQRIRCLGLGYVLAVRSNHLLTLGSGKTVITGAGHRSPSR